ncbi:MAG: hypothetical protein HY318_03385 [Armatimonadetes bacterium]|nr:hypothetical protein [Armatimonadota bacterium]
MDILHDHTWTIRGAAYLLCLLSTMALKVAASAQDAGQREDTQTVIDLGSRLELFVDSWLLDQMKGVTLQMHSPVPREVAVTCEAPWEGPTTGFVTVMKDEDRYRMYFPSDRSGVSYTAYAESNDGITWRKPKLGIIEFDGSKDNNLIWAGEAIHNFNPFKDANPEATVEERYKSLGGDPAYAFASSDGIHWKKMQEAPVIAEGAFDSQNLAFWDSVQGRYVAYLAISRTGSAPFVERPHRTSCTGHPRRLSISARPPKSTSTRTLSLPTFVLHISMLGCPCDSFRPASLSPRIRTREFRTGS